ncbi:glycosyltransferase [Novosphingobium sp. FSY-8]|uniref:Glycosyltransferase n=1 Tax=Novosphingobium ovatum TaxID=1908523 RepID=A0ABW9XGG2_9SPHN|nr:glycosyltransferase family 4 protein [Novosphingobium ovatum]NBC37640.1 glycosyltransferase [Novosphingobium ovatum]
MKILISDYCGHPFQVQLSRELARRGHQVLHMFFAGFQTPKGNLVRSESDPAGFDITYVNTRETFRKMAFVRRRQQEIEVGHALAAKLREFQPDIVISSNTPLDTQRIFQKAAREVGADFVFWLQDIYSFGISHVVPRKLPVLGHLVAAFYRWLEFKMLASSDRIVAITSDFRQILADKGISTDKIDVIENWAPLDELPSFPRENEWARANMHPDKLRFVYSGTLGYKHDPSLLLELAQRQPDAHVHVFSEGDPASGLARDAQAAGVTNLTVHPWVSFADLPKMLSGADVFVAIIEAEAGVYCVPSKILTYLAVGRPILASMPGENLAARLLEANDAGRVAPPKERAAFMAHAAELAADADLRASMGEKGRAYAARTFDIGLIADKFETLIARLPHGRAP